MKIKEYTDMYQKMKLSNEMDETLRNHILESKKKKRSIVDSKRVVAAAMIAFGMLVFALNPSAVSAAIDTVSNYVTLHVIVSEEDGNETSVDLQEGYCSLLETAPTKKMFYDSMKEAGKAIGVDLLDSSSYYAYSDCIEYMPSLDSNGNLAGITLKDNFYAVGDLQDVKVTKKITDDSQDTISYGAGENYGTPIASQVAIFSDEDLTKEYTANELGFAGGQVDLDLTEESYHAEVYSIDQIGVDAVIFEMESDGPIAWGLPDDGTTVTLVNALFVYNGVEYMYFGEVDHDTMKEFLDTLE